MSISKAFLNYSLIASQAFYTRLRAIIEGRDPEGDVLVPVPTPSKLPNPAYKRKETYFRRLPIIKPKKNNPSYISTLETF